MHKLRIVSFRCFAQSMSYLLSSILITNKRKFVDREREKTFTHILFLSDIMMSTTEEEEEKRKKLKESRLLCLLR